MALFPCPKPKKRRRSKKAQNYDQPYKDWIKSLPCIITGKYSIDPDTGEKLSDPHHVTADGHGIMAGKASDRRCIPLTHELHNEAHVLGKHSFAAKYGLNYEQIIRRLNEIYDSLGN